MIVVVDWVVVVDLIVVVDLVVVVDFVVVVDWAVVDFAVVVDSVVVDSVVVELVVVAGYFHIVDSDFDIVDYNLFDFEYFFGFAHIDYFVVHFYFVDFVGY